MSAIRLVTFDVTNTIIRVAGNVGYNYCQMASKYNTIADPTKIDKAFPKVYKDYTKKYPNFGVFNDLTPNKWWTMVVKETFREAGYEDDHLDKIAQDLYTFFASSEGWEILPEAISTLQQITDRGVLLGAVSNFDERLEQVLNNLDIRHYFQFVLSSTVVKCEKPSKDIFKMAMKAVKCKPEESLHIGDNVITDYEGATGAGMNALLLWNKTKAIPEAVDTTRVVYHLADVLKFL